MIAGPAQNAEGAQRPGTPAVVVVLPTYNEAGAVVDVLRRLMKVQCAPDVLVVDDSSPDGTGDVVRRFAAQDGAGRIVKHTRQRSPAFWLGVSTRQPLRDVVRRLIRRGGRVCRG